MDTLLLLLSCMVIITGTMAVIQPNMEFDENNTDVPLCCHDFGEGEFWGDVRR